MRLEIKYKYMHQHSDLDGRAGKYLQSCIEDKVHEHSGVTSPQSIDVANCEAERTGGAPCSHPAIFACVDQEHINTNV